MGRRVEPLRPVAKAGLGALGIVACVTLGALLAVAWTAHGLGPLRSADLAALRFTVLQAALSAAISVALAIPVARALARRDFPLRSALVTLLGAPFILPVIVAVMGLLAIFGRGGLLSDLAASVGWERLEIFGLTGVVLAHVFLNLPLAVRFLVAAWQRIPSERLRLASSLGFDASAMWRHFEAPLLREIVPGAFAAIFLICSTSFAVALILGGGPRATTLELAIYQAFRFDFDLARAASLGLLQVALCMVAGVLAVRFALPRALGAGFDRPPEDWPPLVRGAWYLDVSALALVAVFLLAPIGVLVLRGLVVLPDLPATVWQAGLRSLILAVLSAFLSVGMALGIAALMVWGRVRGAVEAVANLGIAVSPLVIGTGLFILLRPWAAPEVLALPVTGVVNAVVSLPFVMRGLVPALAEAQAGQGRLAEALGMRLWPTWRYALLPRMRRSLGFGAGLAAALSAGDLGVIALFSLGENATLPLEMYRLMGSYRTDDAAGAALLLMLLSLGLFWAFDRLGRGRDRA